MPLGTGEYEVFLADRGGERLISALDGVAALRWERVRDDVSTASVQVVAPSPACCAVLGDARTVRHELVVVRNGKRVWEGPLTRLVYSGDRVELHAADPLWFAFRWPLRSDFSHPTGANSVNALLPVMQDVYGSGTDKQGFNCNRWLTPINGPDDPRTISVYPAYSRTVGELFDAFAEDGGVDYTVVGRRIMWWDTHLVVGELPRLTDADFMADLTLSEYGAELATAWYQTDNEGGVTVARADAKWLDFYGEIAHVQSNTNEEQPGAAGSEQPAQPADAPAVELLRRVPAPMRVHVPDNTGLSPDAPVTVEQLVPGAFAMIRSTRTCRVVEQPMKLSAVVVNKTDRGETIDTTWTAAPSKMVRVP